MIVGTGKAQGLYHQGNKLQGPVPEDICNIPSLAFLSLSSNELDGSMPLCIGNLTSLKELHLGSYQFTSTISNSLWSLNNIMMFKYVQKFSEPRSFPQSRKSEGSDHRRFIRKPTFGRNT
ncbi:hypothetical protein ACJRO7_020929 [Eucalyptus globulus]|uniref:Uncharacterized protein n=1 Tax=Eucalyptus globulus TaxID=34317 RepID=A0ABD3KPD4_EUCGL